MESVETIGITKQQNASSNIKIGLGHVIQYDVYPHIQEILSQLVKFDKRYCTYIYSLSVR